MIQHAIMNKLSNKNNKKLYNNNHTYDNLLHKNHKYPCLRQDPRHYMQESRMVWRWGRTFGGVVNTYYEDGEVGNNHKGKAFWLWIMEEYAVGAWGRNINSRANRRQLMRP